MTEKIFRARRDHSVDSTHTRSAQNEQRNVGVSAV